MPDDEPTGVQGVERAGDPQLTESASPASGTAASTTESAPQNGDPASDEPTPRRRTRRFAMLGVALCVVIAAILVIRGEPLSVAPQPAQTTLRGSGAALRAPETPALSQDPDSGVRLTGFVVDGAGLPVAGAEVTAEPERGAPDRALAPLPRVDPGSGSATPTSPASAAPVVSTAPPTGSDGRFVIFGLSPGRFRVQVTGPGLIAAELRYVPVPSDEARIVVARQVAIEGVVTDGGKPVANAQVGLRSEAIGGTIELRSDARGAFKFENLPEGRFQLFAWRAALAARTIRIARLGAGPFGPVELRLEAASIVVGRVIDRDEGTGVVAAIELRPSGDDQAPRYARSGDDGVFRIEGVPSGRWIADAFAPGFISPGGVELTAGRGVAEIALTRGGAIEGRVLDGDGQPIAGATVRTLTAGANPTEVSAEVDRDKLRRFSGRTAAPVPVAPPPGVLASDPQLIARGELGVLVGPIPAIPPPGARVAQAAIAIDPSLAGEPPPLPGVARPSIWTTGTDGVYRITGLATSKVTVLATAPGFAEARSKPLAIALGQHLARVDLIVTPGTLVRGRVTNQRGAPVVGAQVTAAGVGARGADAATGAAISAFTDDDGEYTLGPLSGTVELQATAYGHGDARRTVELVPATGRAPGEQREDLTLVVADAVVAGILEDATGAPVAGAHLDVVGGVSDGRHAVVAGDGTFSLDLLPQGPLRLRITHPAYPPDDAEVIAASGDPVRVRLRLPLGGGVEGVLLDAASGAAIPSATLAAAGPDNALAEASTDKTGRFKLLPLRLGRWKLTIKLPGYLAATHELDVPAATAPGGTSVRDVRIELARGALIGGTVRDSRGQRVVGARVVAIATTGTGPTCEGDTDGQGEFRIHDCPTGDLAITASKADAQGGVRATIRPGNEILSLAIELR